jgi:ribosomal protein L25 (general stress protein Ctc)
VPDKVPLRLLFSAIFASLRETDFACKLHQQTRKLSYLRASFFEKSRQVSAMEKIVIPAQGREVAGTKGATATRREGRIPAVIYGGGDPLPVSVSLHDVRHAIYTPDFHRVKVELNGETISCILKECAVPPGDG